MKFKCECNEIIYDISDSQEDKARWISSEQWDPLIWALERLTEFTTETKKERDQAVFDFLREFRFKSMFQCRNCGNVYIDDNKGLLEQFRPSEVVNNYKLFKK